MGCLFEMSCWQRNGDAEQSTGTPSSGSGEAPQAAVHRNFGLPEDDNAGEWKALLLPHRKRLKLVSIIDRRRNLNVCLTSRCLSRVVRLTAVDVWLYFGLHYRAVQEGEVEPTQDDFPVEQGLRRWRFVALCRDKPDGRPSFGVRCPLALQGVEASLRERIVEVYPMGDTERQLNSDFFVADSAEGASLWAKQLVLRAAPLALIWKRALGVGLGSEVNTACASV